MTRLAWLPYRDLDEAATRLGGIPDGIKIDCFPSDGDWPDSIADVEYYVLSKAAPVALSRAAEMPSLKYVQLLYAGYESVLPHVPPGVTLCNGGGIHDTATSEHAIGLALALGHRLDESARNQPEGTWRGAEWISLADQRVLIIGYGRIGSAIERRLAGFEVASVTRVARRARTEPEVHPVERLPELLPEADVVFLIAPLTPETAGMIDSTALKLLPDNALLVNVGRGRLIDTDALVAETSSGRIRAALDVTDPEPLPPDHPLWRTPGVLISPHVGGWSTAYEPRADRFLAAQLRRLAAGEELENVINV